MALNGARGTVTQQDGCKAGRAAVVLDEGRTTKSFALQNLYLLPEARMLLRDCVLLVPRGSFHQLRATECDHTVLSWRGRCSLDARGRANVRGSSGPPSRVEREGCLHVLRVVASAPLPSGMRVEELELRVCGMDQGWGNSGHAGVAVRLARGNDEDMSTVVKVTYDRTKSRSVDHIARATWSRGPAAPQPGDCLEVLLLCPEWNGWSAYADSIEVVVRGIQEEETPLPGVLPDGWHAQACAAFERLWQGLSEDTNLDVDMSHLSLRGQERQRVWTPAVELAANASDTGPVLPRLIALCQTRGVKAEGAVRFLEKLDTHTGTGGAPQDPEVRRTRYRALRATVHATLRAMEGEGNAGGFLLTVCQHYADAADECIYRWERDIANMHDLVTGEFTGDDSLPAEDAVLRVLCTARRRMAEAALHRAKGAAHNSDMHFESYFYASIHFGLPEQAEALRDPNRLNYRDLNMLSPEDIQAELLGAYTPAAIRAIIRQSILESSAPGTQALREKIVDWLRAQCPMGFRPDAADARQEAWVFEQCHEGEVMRLRDAALNFLLLRMRVLSGERLARLYGGDADVPPQRNRRTAPPRGSAAPRDERGGGCMVQ
eukprot:NODE_1498_length_2457_cov_8.255794.p1 GENE.NODE_1498_length_2457_cov_8.255794~~NODE_1498_length_2457_cov_8.255794.p1  ORF type:complete len:710 (+),score=202.10 NODE_1498_length_2457_cov_8.255794:320-2131(+)